MEQAKKYDTIELHLPKDDARALERRYSYDYKSAATSATQKANTSSLENFIKTIEREDVPKDSLLDSLLYYAQTMLQQIGYTHTLVESKSKRKIKKYQHQLSKQLSATDDAIVFYDQQTNKIDEYIASLSFELEGYQDEYNNKKKELAKFEKEISDYTLVTKNSLKPQENMRLKQAKLDYELDEQKMDDVLQTCDVVFTSIQEYYAHKSQNISLKSLYEANKITLQSNLHKLDFALENSSRDHHLKTIAMNKYTIVGAYKLQEEILSTDARLTQLYNKKVDELPSDKFMSTSLMEKRQSLPKIKR